MTAHLYEIPAQIWRQWFAAGATGPVSDALTAIYHDMQSELARRKPVCQQSGRCCHFETFGHKLYVTGLEICWMVGRLGAADRAKLDAPQQDELLETDGCPFQVDGLCTVHAIRPLGCRVFFCDPDAQVWQSEVYETFNQRLRDLHDRRQLPYRYMEWRFGLDQARQHK